MFTPNQKLAVESDARELLVIAGAGSGKTHVLTHSIGRRLETQHSSKFLIITFTRRAAREMRERLLKLTNNSPKVKQLMLGTFHAIALHIIMVNANLLGYRGKINVVDPGTAKEILKLAIEEVGSKLSVTRAGRELERYYTGCRAWPKIDASAFRDDEEHKIALVLGRYFGLLRQFNALDFGSMLRECDRLLNENPGLQSHYEHTFTEVYVDEYHDTDLIQYNLHDRFRRRARFFAVLDPRQSIYGWRGSRPDVIRDKHPDATVIQLPDNFRSGVKIVEASNRLIANNSDHEAEPMRSANGDEGDVRRWSMEDVDAVSALKAVLAEGYAFAEVAMISRKHASLSRMSNALLDAGIPHQHVGRRDDVVESQEFALVRSIVSMVADPNNDLGFFLLSRMLPGVSYAAVQAVAKRDGVSCLDAMSKTMGRKFVGGATELDVVLDLIPDEPDLDCDHSELMAAVELWKGATRGMDAQEALEWYSNHRPGLGEDFRVGNAVTLITAHGSKGLEWPIVVVFDCHEGSFPTQQSFGDEELLQEERRVFYVAITRAKRLLILLLNPVDNLSRFVTECGDFPVVEVEPVSSVIF